MSLFCYLTGHKHSRPRAHYDRTNAHWVSRCKRCSMFMVRDPEPTGQWHTLPIADRNSRATAIIAKKAMLTVAFVGGVVMAGSARAATFVDQGNTTLDTNTGLEWLDLTLTNNKSPDEILAGYGGYLGAGFHIATWAEVQRLVQDAGFPGLGYDDPAYFTAALTLVPLLGPTFGFSDSYSGFQGLADASGYYRDPSVTYYLQANGMMSGQTTNCCGAYGSDAHFNAVGVYLVRAVPEPSTWLLMLLGFSGMGLALRRPNKQKLIII